MIRVARVVLIASLALWVGGLATISFVLAPTAFKVAPSRQVAGQIVGTSLRTFGTIEIVCGALAVASSIFLRRKTGRGNPVVGLVVVMLIITLVYVGFVYPAAAVAREEMNLPQGVNLNAPEQFAVLHRVSVWMVGTNILLGATALGFAAAARSDGP
jgi:uncharacterized membrane protein